MRRVETIVTDFAQGPDLINALVQIPHRFAHPPALGPLGLSAQIDRLHRYANARILPGSGGVEIVAIVSLVGVVGMVAALGTVSGVALSSRYT